MEPPGERGGTRPATDARVSGALVPVLARAGGDDGLAWAQSVVDACRSLITVTSAEEAVSVLTTCARALGGEVVPARLGRDDAVPIDLSLGEGEPLVACAPRPSPARLALEAALPSLVDDARSAVAGARLAGRSHDSPVDPDTGLYRRRELVRLLPRLGEADTLLLVELRPTAPLLDGRRVAVLRSLARTVRATLRLEDVAFAYGDTQVLVALRRVPAETVEPLAVRLHGAWWASRPDPDDLAMVGAVLRGPDGRAALAVAESALRRVGAGQVLVVEGP